MERRGLLQDRLGAKRSRQATIGEPAIRVRSDRRPRRARRGLAASYRRAAPHCQQSLNWASRRSPQDGHVQSPAPASGFSPPGPVPAR